ncbi:differentially expressed in FDCP 8-like [Diadema antillarum]|uniref:differentially expressed in FDCP 8-like n=1 Tax=Diadema antillarum TaxID=105358 RepID=UPI003A8C8115
MSRPGSIKDSKVNTFITSAAVIKFSGGSVGTDDWTDSEDEESPEGGQADHKGADSSRENEKQRPVTKRPPPKKGEQRINGSIIMNGNAGPLSDSSRDSLHQRQNAHSPSSHQTVSTSSWIRSTGPHLPHPSASETSDFERPGEREDMLNEVSNPFLVATDEDEVPSHATPGGFLGSEDGQKTSAGHRHADEEFLRSGQSFSQGSEADISLPSEDQDLALITNEDLGISENHFSQPEGFFGFSKVEELEMAIENCKDAVRTTKEHSEQRRKLVAKLVQLRLKLLQIKEGEEEEESEDVKTVLGHRFQRMKGKSLNDQCEVCLSVIWALLQTSYRCFECGFSCHGKCLNSVRRQCVSTKISGFDLNICPDRGLSTQNYRCAECRAPLTFNGVQPEPRLCDYSGLYYCNLCHWNDLEVIPARVIHNWDFEPRKVCRQSKQLLQLMSSRAVLRIQDLNPMLFSYVEELSQIKRLREEVLIMKVYFLSCRNAMEEKLLKRLQNRPHFVENSDTYSLQDLLDAEEGSLLSELATIHGDYAVHIRIECQLCQAKGFICELCNRDEILYPFDMIATVCANCSAVYHRDCYYKRSGECPKCLRMSQRASTERPAPSRRIPIYK